MKDKLAPTKTKAQLLHTRISRTTYGLLRRQLLALSAIAKTVIFIIL